jgi:hypothetical protein
MRNSYLVNKTRLLWANMIFGISTWRREIREILLIMKLALFEALCATKVSPVF